MRSKLSEMKEVHIAEHADLVVLTFWLKSRFKISFTQVTDA